MAAAGLPRPRLGLRDASIRAKLGLILVIPLLAIASLTIIRLVDSGQRALSAKLVSALTALSGDVADTTHQFQRERILAAQYLDGAIGSAVFVKQTQQTNTAIDGYRLGRKISGLPAPVRARLDRIDQQLSIVDTMRQQVVSQQGITAAEAVVRYGVIIDDLVAYPVEIAQYATDPGLADSMRAVARILNDPRPDS